MLSPGRSSPSDRVRGRCHRSRSGAIRRRSPRTAAANSRPYRDAMARRSRSTSTWAAAQAPAQSPASRRAVAVSIIKAGTANSRTRRQLRRRSGPSAIKERISTHLARTRPPFHNRRYPLPGSVHPPPNPANPKPNAAFVRPKPPPTAIFPPSRSPATPARRQGRPAPAGPNASLTATPARRHPASSESRGGRHAPSPHPAASVTRGAVPDRTSPCGGVSATASARPGAPSEPVRVGGRRSMAVGW